MSEYKDLVNIERLGTFKNLIDGQYPHKNDLSAYVKTADSGVFATTTDLEKKQDVSGMTAYATKSEIPTDLFTKASADTLYQAKGDYVSSSDMTAYYTKTESNEKFLTAHQSLEEYAKKDELPSTYFTKESADTLYQAKGDYLVANDITGKQDVSGMTAYATKSEIPTDLFTKASADTLYQPKGDYLVANDITGKQDKSAMTAYYTKDESDEKFLTAHQSLEAYQTTADMTAYAKTGDIPTDLFTKASADTLYISTAKSENYDSAYNYASSHSGTLTFKRGTTEIGTFNGTSSLEVEVGGGSTPTENGDYIYRKTDEFDGWYNISEEGQEIEGASGVEVTSDTTTKKTTISLTTSVQEKISKIDDQLEISGGNGISITSADGKLVIASNGIVSVETDTTLSGDGSTQYPLGINKENELEISGGEGISVTSADGKLIISSNGIASIETDETLSGNGSTLSPLGINGSSQLKLVEGDNISIKKNEDETELSISVSGMPELSYYEIAKANDCENTATVNGRVVSGYAHGKSTIVDNDFMTVVGRYNLQYPNSDTLFAVGDGTEETRKNTFSVSHKSIVFGGNGSVVSGNTEHILCFGLSHEIDESKMLTIFGEGNSANSASYSLVNGKENKLSEYDYSFLNGSNNSTRNSEYDIINGNLNSSTNMNYSIIAGNGNAVSGDPSLEYSTIFGSNNRIAGTSHNFINGDQNLAAGKFNQILGQGNAAIGGLNFVVGVTNSAINTQSNMLLGKGNVSMKNGCILMGNDLSSNADMQIILGAKNDVNDMIDGLYTPESEYYETNTGVLPMFVLAGDSKSYSNSHTVYKDGQIKLRFDKPNYGEGGEYDVDEVTLNYPYFQKQKSVSDVVVSSSGYFYEPINGTNTTIVTGVADDGHKTFKVNVTQTLDDSPVIVTGEGNIQVASGIDTETSKPKFTITLDDVAATEYYGDDLVGVDFATRKISATETLSAMLVKPSALYETTASETPYVQYSSNKVVIDEAVVDTSISVVNGSAYSSSNEWSKMVLPTTGEYITNDMLANGLKMMVVPPDYDLGNAPANTFIFKVKATE